MARHLRASGVPGWEVAAQLGHKKRDLSITEIYAPFDPAYLEKSVEAIDDFLRDLLRPPEEKPLITLPVRCQSDFGDSTKPLFPMVGAPGFEPGTSTMSR